MHETDVSVLKKYARNRRFSSQQIISRPSFDVEIRFNGAALGLGSEKYALIRVRWDPIKLGDSIKTSV